VKRVLIADGLNAAGIDALRKQGLEVEVTPTLGEAALVARIPEYEGLIVRSATKVTRAAIEAARKLEVIGRAAELVRATGIEIRPHPRELEAHPHRLAERLAARGLRAVVTDPGEAPLASVACGCAAVLGPPSGALSEAAAACRAVAVVCVEGMQGRKPEAPVSAFSPDIVSVRPGEPIEPSHFARPAVSRSSAGSVGEVVGRLLRGQPLDGAAAAEPEAEPADVGLAGVP